MVQKVPKALPNSKLESYVLSHTASNFWSWKFEEYLKCWVTEQELAKFFPGQSHNFFFWGVAEQRLSEPWKLPQRSAAVDARRRHQGYIGKSEERRGRPILHHCLKVWKSEISDITKMSLVSFPLKLENLFFTETMLDSMVFNEQVGSDPLKTTLIWYVLALKQLI